MTESVLFHRYVGGVFATPDSATRFQRGWKQFLESAAAHSWPQPSTGFSTFLADQALRGSWRLVLLDVWTSTFDRTSLLRHKLTLSLALAECDPDLQAAFWPPEGHATGASWPSRLGLLRDGAAYATLLLASCVLVAWYGAWYLGFHSRATQPNILNLPADSFDNTDPRVSNAAEEATLMVAMTLPLHPRSALDIGTGSGFAAVTLAEAGVAVTATDVNRSALEVTTRNAKRRGVTVRTLVSDLFADVTGQFDVILFNPPLMPSEPGGAGGPTWLAHQVRRSRALTRASLALAPILFGRARLRLLRRLLEGSRQRLHPGGNLIIYITATEERWIGRRFPEWRQAERVVSSFDMIVVRLSPIVPT